MILAESDSIPTWMAAVGVLVGGPLTAAVSGAVVWLVKERRSHKRDTITDLYAIIDRQQKQLDGQTMDIKGLTERASKAEVAEARCRGEVSRLESDVRGMNNDIRRLQERIYDTPPGVSKPCQIIASIPDGIITHCSIEAGSMFHWNPDELIGQQVTVLMPRDVRPLHKRSMERMIEEKRQADPSRAVLTFGVTKEGKRFPITVNLSGPWEGRDSHYVNAEIRRRGDSDFTPPVSPITPETLSDTVRAPVKEGDGGL